MNPNFRSNKLPAETVNRIRILATSGHSDPQIATLLNLGIVGRSVQKIRTRYGIESGCRSRRIIAAPYVTNHDEIDEAAVLRLLAGDRTIPQYRRATKRAGRRLNPDVVEAIARLARQGNSDVEIVERLPGRFGTCAAVLKVRERHGIPSGYWIAAGAA